jgi:glucose 1-dehydrogenase
MGKLDGRVALVSGASRGIGRGCAVAFAREGAHVVVNYLSHPEDAAETARLVEEFGRQALVVKADVSQRAQVEAMFEAAVQRFGHIDIAVANAYRSIRAPFIELTPEAFEQTLAVTLFGAFHVAHVAARLMVEQGTGGKIIFISSIHSEQPFALSAAYNAAKAAVNNLAMTMANELARYRIHVNVIAPGWTDTPGERQFATEQELQAAAKKLPFGRLATIDEIGRVAAFLASDDASYVSGAYIRVDGAEMTALR